MEPGLGGRHGLLTSRTRGSVSARAVQGFVTRGTWHIEGVKRIHLVRCGRIRENIFHIGARVPMGRARTPRVQELFYVHQLCLSIPETLQLGHERRIRALGGHKMV